MVSSDIKLSQPICKTSAPICAWMQNFKNMMGQPTE